MLPALMLAEFDRKGAKHLYFEVVIWFHMNNKGFVRKLVQMWPTSLGSVFMQRKYLQG